MSAPKDRSDWTKLDGDKTTHTPKAVVKTPEEMNARPNCARCCRFYRTCSTAGYQYWCRDCALIHRVEAVRRFANLGPIDVQAAK